MSISHRKYSFPQNIADVLSHVLSQTLSQIQKQEYAK